MPMPICVCGCQCNWEANFDTEDYGIEQPGIVGVYHCPNCGADIQVTTYVKPKEMCVETCGKV